MGALAAFDVDLRYGEAREDAFVYVLCKALVEVKSDRKAADTGNVFVEFQQGLNGSKRASGIAASKASWWAIEVAADRWVLITLDELKDLARRAHSEGRIKNGGDNGNVGVLVPVEWLVRPATKETP